MDATLLYLETETSNSNFGLLCRFDGPIPFDDYVTDFKCRRIGSLPRFRQVVAPVPLNLGFPTWEDDPRFDLESHLHHICLEPPGSEQQLREICNRLIGRRIDFRRPPWDIFIVNGLHDGGSVVVFHMHHCITDGVGFLKILRAVFDATPTPFITGDAAELTFPSPPPLPGSFERLKRALRDRFVRRAKDAPTTGGAEETAARKAAEKERSAAFNMTMKEFIQAPGIRLPFNEPLSGRIHACGVAFHLEELRVVSSALGGTVNDTLLTILAGAIDRMSEELGIEVAGKYCRAYQAANARTANELEQWGNRLAFLPALLPLGLTDPSERFRQIAAFTKRAKERGVREAADVLIRGFQTKLPPPLAKLGLRLMLARGIQKLGAMSKRPPVINIYVTNVRLPEFTAYLGERRMAGLTGIAPLVPNTGVTCSAVNYDGKLHIGVTADSESMPDLDTFIAQLTQARDELLAVVRGHSSSSSTPP